jgi:NADH-quinone oxidoreductase subunit L
MTFIVLPVRDKLSAATYWFNQNVLDGVVNGAALLTRGVSHGIAWIDRNIVDGAVNALGGLAGATGGLLRYLQTGNVQWYAVGLFAGVIVLTAYFVNTS